MKTTKRFIAMAAALTLTACAAMPMASFAEDPPKTITITELSSSQARTFEVYQVFTGDLTNGTFTNLKWGSGVSKYKNEDVTPGELVNNTIIDDLGDDARVIANRITTSSTKIGENDWTSSGESLAITVPVDGYYLIKDVTNLDGKDDANSAFIVQVAGTATKSIKVDKPTLDKQVYDNDDGATTGDNNGWGETADHAINESFQFKLTATIPGSDEIAAYDTYKLVFTDTMSTGVTFESIESVSVGGTPINSYTTNKVGSDPAAAPASGDAGIAWTLTIDDVKSLVPQGKTWGSDEIVVEVIYNAHLNNNAVVDSASRSGGTAANTNNNKAKLTYSNNPDSTGAGGTNSTGETPEDNTWVFTYKVDNIKKQISETGNVLPGAKFQILKGTTAIKLIDNGDGTYTVANQTATTNVTDTMISNAEGIFNIKGLDAGTYTLRETEAPDGYNEAPDKTITISATHDETTETANLTLSNASTMSNTIVDTKNNTLPSTGGMGTTLFILGGGCAAGIAGIYLISKKKTREEE